MFKDCRVVPGDLLNNALSWYWCFVGWEDVVLVSFIEVPSYAGFE